MDKGAATCDALDGGLDLVDGAGTRTMARASKPTRWIHVVKRPYPDWSWSAMCPSTRDGSSSLTDEHT